MANAVMLLPGLLCDWALWEGVQAGLAADCQVADLSLDDSIAAMAARTLAAAPPRFAVVGLSMGGYVALEIMRQAPERVTHLALLDSAAGADSEARKEQRRGGMVATQQGKFGLVVQAMVPGLLAPDHVDGPLADDCQGDGRAGGAGCLSAPADRHHGENRFSAASGDRSKCRRWWGWGHSTR